MSYTAIGEEYDYENADTSSVTSEYQPLSNHFDDDPFVSNIIITDQVEKKSTARLCCDVIKAILCFPTKVTVICGVVVGVWLFFCISTVSLGAAFSAYEMCPGNPAVPVTMMIHGSAWIAMCCYIIVRLICVEIKKGRVKNQLGFGNGKNPEAGLKWRSEHLVDFLMLLLLMATFMALWLEVVVQSSSNSMNYYYEITLLAWCEQCCLGYVMRAAIGLMIVSTGAILILILTYFYFFGCLTKLRELCCKPDLARTKDESVTLM